VRHLSLVRHSLDYHLSLGLRHNSQEQLLMHRRKACYHQVFHSCQGCRLRLGCQEPLHRLRLGSRLILSTRLLVLLQLLQLLQALLLLHLLLRMRLAKKKQGNLQIQCLHHLWTLSKQLWPFVLMFQQPKARFSRLTYLTQWHGWRKDVLVLSCPDPHLHPQLL